jgi:hypothetical protein
MSIILRIVSMTRFAGIRITALPNSPFSPSLPPNSIVYVGAIDDPILDAPPKNPIVAISCCPQEFGQPLILIVESFKLSSVSNPNSKKLRCISFANL